jgi:hypothetical protein
MKETMKKYLRLWRLGWVAVVAVLLGGVGLNLVGLLVRFISPENDIVNIFGMRVVNFYSGVVFNRTRWDFGARFYVRGPRRLKRR